MGMSVNSGNTSVTGTLNATVGCPSPNAAQTIVTVCATANGSQQSAYTVTAGKTFYLMGVTCSSSQTGYLEIRNNAGTRILYLYVTNGQSTDSTISSGSPIAVYTAAQVVKVIGTSGQIHSFWGFEQ